MKSKQTRKRKQQKIGDGSRKRKLAQSVGSISTDDTASLSKKRKVATAKRKRNPAVRTHGEFNDNGLNLSNRVPPYKVLRSLIDPSYPILYFPEYVKRRCSIALSGTSERGGTDNVASEIAQGLKREYLILLQNHQHEKIKNEERCNPRGRKRRRNMSSSHWQNEQQKKKKIPSGSVPNLEKRLGSELDCRLLARTIIIPLCSDLISKVSHPMKCTSDTTRQDNLVHQESKESQEQGKEAKRIDQVVNWYKKARPKEKFLNQSEPLGALVDGVISSLVERRERSRRRLQTNKTKSSDGVVHSQVYHGRNMLAEGYRYSSGREASTIHYVGNMNPGVQYISKLLFFVCSLVSHDEKYA